MATQDDFVKSYLSAWNRHDATGVMEHLSDDGLYNDVPAQQQLGGDALVRHLTDYFSDDHYRYELVGEVLVNADTIAFQYRVCPIDPSSDEPIWGGAEFIRMVGAEAREINDYYRLPDPPAQQREASEGQRSAKSGLTDEAMQQLLNALEYAMNEERVYLDPELSLPRLAEHLDCSVNHLSQVINAGHSMSFFDYINSHRVQEAARMLRQKDSGAPAILTIALSVGFNSTSTFYTAFRKATGQTPARYRRGSGG